MSYLKSVIMGLLGGFVVIGLLPFIAIIIVAAGFLGKIKDGAE